MYVFTSNVPKATSCLLRVTQNEQPQTFFPRRGPEVMEWEGGPATVKFELMSHFISQGLSLAQWRIFS